MFATGLAVHSLGHLDCNGAEANLLECPTSINDIECGFIYAAVRCAGMANTAAFTRILEPVCMIICTFPVDLPRIRQDPAFVDSEIALEAGRRFLYSWTCRLEDYSGNFPAVMSVFAYKDGVLIGQGQRSSLSYFCITFQETAWLVPIGLNEVIIIGEERFELEDAGNYSCIGENVLGKTYLNFTVTVLG